MATSRLVKVALFTKALPKSLQKSTTEALRKVCPGAEFNYVSIDTVSYDISTGAPQIKDDLIKSLHDAEVIVSEPWLVFPFLDKLPNLKWMQGTWDGFDGTFKYSDPSQLRENFVYTKLGGAFPYQMAQYVMSYILTIERHIIQAYKNQEKKKWVDLDYYRKLSDLTVGILGVGEIGSEVARIVKSFGMKTWGLVNRDLPKEKRSADIDEYRLVSELEELLVNCDYLCNILPSTSKTIGLLSGDVLSHCKKKPVFINIGRGDVTTDESIINAIKKGWISKAVLDVFEKEPLPEDSPLWTMPEVIITPHCAGMTLDYSITDLFCENYNRYINGQPLKYVIEDWARGY